MEFWTLVGVIAIVCGIILAARYGLRTYQAFTVANPVDTLGEAKPAAVNGGKAALGLLIFGVGIKLIIGAFLMVMVFSIAPAQAEGNDIRYPVYQGTVMKDKIARNIASRPNVEVDRRIAKQSGANQVHHICGLGGQVFCHNLRGVAARSGGEVHAGGGMLADHIIATRPTNLIITGQSLGCVDAMEVAAKVKEHGITVRKVLCFDGASFFGKMPGEIPSNILLILSWRQGNPLSLGGARLCNGKTYAGICREKRGRTIIHEETVPTMHSYVPMFVRAQAVAAIRN